MNNLKIINGFLLQPGPSAVNAFEELYIAVRLREGRIYSEDEIACLPSIRASHPYYKEWQVRRRSCNKLLRYIKRNSQICNILEVGCGNGWLSAQLASLPKVRVTGLDINGIELEQAEKVFRGVPNLRFVEADIRSGILTDEKFDMVIFAASVQYLESLKETLKSTLQCLTLRGEIHITDSRLYQPYEIAPARQRSQKYFADIGFAEMSKYYFHHCIQEIESFGFSILHNPDSWKNRILFRKNPFHWIVIRNHYNYM